METIINNNMGEISKCSKNILIIERNWAPLSFIKNNISGTTYINKLIMNLYHDNYDIYFCTNNIVEFDDNLYNVHHIIYELDNCDTLINQIKDIHFQLCIFTIDFHQEIIENLHKYCSINKYLFINHFPYWCCKTELYDKIITVGEHDEEHKGKYIYIHNPFDHIYENINLNNIQKDHSIIICCGRCKIYEQDIVKLQKIILLVKEIISDFYVKVCYPQYDCLDIDNDNIINLGSLSHEELKNELLKTPISYRIYDFKETCPIGTMFEAVCGCFLLSNFHCGMNSCYLEEYINKYGCKNKSDEEIANLIIDVILNYDKYKEDIIKNQQYIYSNFTEDKIIRRYKKEIDELL